MCINILYTYTVCVHVCVHAHLVVFDSATPWTVAYQAPLSMGFPRQEYWSGLPFPFPGDHPEPGMEHASPAFTGRFFTTAPPGKPHTIRIYVYNI